MEIKYNKDKSVTINATEVEYNMIVAGIVRMYSQTLNCPENSLYKPIMDAMNKAYNEQVLGEGK